MAQDHIPLVSADPRSNDPQSSRDESIIGNVPTYVGTYLGGPRDPVMVLAAASHLSSV